MKITLTSVGKRRVSALTVILNTFICIIKATTLVYRTVDYVRQEISAKQTARISNYSNTSVPIRVRRSNRGEAREINSPLFATFQKVLIEKSQELNLFASPS